MTDEVFGREELTRPIDSEKLNNLFSVERKKKNVTDEEMAEKIARNEYPLRVNYSKKELAQHKAYKDGFLAGLKAGRPQWHDLRKDPNDLPKKSGRYYVCYRPITTHKDEFILIYNKDNNSWVDGVGEHYSRGIIAWCERLTFDKE
jgi:hypothetical protein